MRSFSLSAIGILCCWITAAHAQVGPVDQQPANTIYAKSGQSLNSLVAGLGSSTRTLVIASLLPPLSGDLTVPNNVELSFVGEGQISCGSFTLTIQSSTVNWPSRQIFASDCSSTGSVSFSSNQQSTEIAPEWWGAKADNSRDNQAELSAVAIAAASGGLGIKLSTGTYKHSASLAWLRSGLSIRGVNNQVTVLSYTGSGSQIVTPTSGVRVFRPSFSNFWLSTSTGTVGLALDSVSEGEFRNILLTGSSVACVDIFGATAGFSVYNRFFNVKAQTCGIGHRIQGTSHNGNVWVGSRANACTRGWEITDSNDNSIIGSQSEANSQYGFYIESTSSNLATKNRIVDVRIENNTTAGVHIHSANVIETEVSALWMGSNGVDIEDSGTRTNRSTDLLYVSSLGNITAKSGSLISANSVFLGSTTGAFAGATSGSANVKGQVSNGATAVGVKLSNTNTLSTTGAKVAEFCSDSTCATPVAAIRYNGTVWGLRLQSPDGTWYLLTIANGGTVTIAANP